MTEERSDKDDAPEPVERGAADTPETAETPESSAAAEDVASETTKPEPESPAAANSEAPVAEETAKVEPEIESEVKAEAESEPEPEAADSRAMQPGPTPADESAVPDGLGDAVPSTVDPYENEPYAGLSIFDHPSLNRTLRSTFAEKRLGRAVFLNVLLLVIVFVVVQQAFTRGRLAFEAGSTSFARAAFLAFATVEVGLVSLFLPLSFFGVFYRERKEQCFDQVVVSGVSPVRILGGRLIAALLFFSLTLLSALPFFALTVVMNGASVSMIVGFYAVTFGYMAAMGGLTCFGCVAMDDTGIPVTFGIMSSISVLISAFSSKIVPTFGAFSPIRHIALELQPLMSTLGLGTLAAPSLFGTEIPCSVVSLLIYLGIFVFSFGYVLVGPDLELSPGLNSFDTVAVGRKGEIIRGQRLLSSTLLRTLQIRFLYENMSPRLKRWSPLLRVVAAIVFFQVAHLLWLGATWPEVTPTAFGSGEKRFVFGYLFFTGVSFLLLTFLGAQSRSALRDPRPLFELGGFRLQRFPAVFVVFGLGILFPALLTWLATTATGLGLKAYPVDKLLNLYLLLCTYAVFTFTVALLCAVVTTNPYSASGQTLLVLAAANLLPFLWIITFYFQGRGESWSWVLNLSPFFALYAHVRPGREIPFSTIKDGQPYFHNHLPSSEPFLYVHLGLAVVLLALALWLARRLSRQWRAEQEEAREERRRILADVTIPESPAATTPATASTGGVIAGLVLALLLLLPGQARAAPKPEGENEPPRRFLIDCEAGYDGKVPIGGFVPLRLVVRNSGETTNATVVVSQATGEPMRRFTGVLEAGVDARFSTTIASEDLKAGAVQVSIVDPNGRLLQQDELKTPGPGQLPICVFVHSSRTQPFEIRELSPSFSVTTRKRRRRRGGRNRKNAIKWESAFLTAELAPSSSLGYKGIEAVVLSDASPALDARRAHAITDWVTRGGHLVLCVGDRVEAIRKGPLGEALGDVLDSIPAEAPRRDVALGDFARQNELPVDARAAALGVLRVASRDDRVLGEDATGAPIVLRKTFGAGRITLLAFDLWSSPMRQAPQGAELLSDLLSGPPTQTERSGVLFPVLTTIQTSQARIAPAFTALLLYAFIAGPVVYWVLKAKGRGLLAWVIIPTMTIGVTAATPLYKLILSESDSALFGATVIETFPGTRRAMSTSDLLIFSGGKEQHTLQIQRPYAQAFSVVPRRRVRQSDAVRGELPFTALDSRGFLRIDQLDIAMWGSRYLSVENSLDVAPKFQATLNISKGRIEARLKNSTRFEIKEAFVAYPLVHTNSANIGMVKIGRIKPGDTGEASTGLGSTTLRNLDKKDLFAMLTAGLLQNLYADRVLAQRRAWAFVQLVETDRARRIVPDARLQLSSWTTLASAPAELTFADRIPYGSTRRTRRQKTLGSREGPAGELEELEIAWTFELPPGAIPEDRHVEEIRLQLSPSQSLDKIALEAYDPTTEHWQALALLDILTDPDAKLPPDAAPAVEVTLPTPNRYFPAGHRQLQLRWRLVNTKGFRTPSLRPELMLMLGPGAPR